MITIPNEVFTWYQAHLTSRGCPKDNFSEYKKWLRYYLDFCAKYPVPESKSERVRLFAEKLQDKKQSLVQRQRAANAVSLYFEMLKYEDQAQRKTTMIYTHCVPVRTVKEPKSPLDF